MEQALQLEEQVWMQFWARLEAEVENGVGGLVGVSVERWLDVQAAISNEWLAVA
jgi:hypothetical protein